MLRSTSRASRAAGCPRETAAAATQALCGEQDDGAVHGDQGRSRRAGRWSYTRPRWSMTRARRSCTRPRLSASWGNMWLGLRSRPTGTVLTVREDCGRSV